MPRRLQHEGWLIGLAWLPSAVLMLTSWRGWTTTLALAVSFVAALTATGLLVFVAPRRRTSGLEKLLRTASQFERLSSTVNPGPQQDDVIDRLATSADAVERLLTAQARSNRQLREALNAAESPLFATDGRGVVRLSNFAAVAFFDRPTPLEGTLVDDLFTQAELLSQHAAAVRGESRQALVRMVRAEGLRTVEVATAPAPIDDDGRGVVVTLRDVTEVANASQLKSDFVANASHELRTPLASIRAAVETIENGARDDPAMIDRLSRMIASNVARLEELVRDLLDLSRLESPEAPVTPELVRLSEVCEGLVETFAVATAERKLRIEYEIGPGAEIVDTDPKLLTLVLKNLLENATKFAYESTAVRLVADIVTESGADSKVFRLRVTDRGVGIPFGHQQRIFERFFQVDPSRNGQSNRRGTGLGLAIVKHAVKRLGGTISVESVWKEGTTMTVELPVRNEHHAAK